MSGKPLADDQIAWLEEYRAEVVKAFTAIFADTKDRFSDGERLLRRFNDAVDSVLKGSSFRAVNEAHNELCIAKALVDNTKLRFSALAYEPPLPGCARTIDFRAVAPDGSTLYVDVKTLRPEDGDRWEQFEEAVREDWVPENVNVVLSREWMGGEIWHWMFAARLRMLENTLELESKIRESGLKERADTYFALAREIFVVVTLIWMCRCPRACIFHSKRAGFLRSRFIWRCQLVREYIAVAQIALRMLRLTRPRLRRALSAW